jgi:retron-type reverse transcriptase
MKPANKVGQPAAERVERRAGADGNTGQARTGRAQNRESVSLGLDRLRQVARQRKQERFTALLHHVTVDRLWEACHALRRAAAPGVDGLTWQDYAGNLAALHARLHRGTYRAPPSRRRYIPKPDGRQRPLGIAALEDKIVQRAVVEVLNAIYEVDFLGFSYGFRPRRGQHDALDALAVGIGDERILRLVRKWLQAGVLEDGELRVSAEGTPQGAVISPLLANVYLHYVFDLWAHRWRRREASGHVIFVRHADGVVAGFQYEADARHFWEAMRARLEQFALTLHPDKTRLLEFGRRAAQNRQRRGLGKPETFTFLKFIFICGKSRQGRFLLQRKTRGDRLRAKLRAVKDQLRRRLHEPIPAQGRWLKQLVTGFFASHAVPTNARALGAFRYHVIHLWRRTLRRRSQKDGMTWERMARIADAWLPRPRILHPWPERRFAVTHPRWEPSARIAHAGICAGGAR